MDSFDITINAETYKIIRSSADDLSFSVFNHSTFHVIQRNTFGIWKPVEHRFGTESLPLDEIGEAIDRHYGDSSPGQDDVQQIANG